VSWRVVEPHFTARSLQVAAMAEPLQVIGIELSTTGTKAGDVIDFSPTLSSYSANSIKGAQVQRRLKK